MTVRRKDDNETDLEREARIAKTAASNFSLRSEKTSWIRKRNNLEQFISENINPVEELIGERHAAMMALYPKLAEIVDEDERLAYAQQYIIPIEQEIQAMQNSLIALYDEVDNQRREMISSCIHPYDELRYNFADKTVRCTFCNKKMLPRERV